MTLEFHATTWGRNERLSNDHPKITRFGEFTLFWVAKNLASKKKKTEGISKHPPTFCRLRSQNLGIKNSQPEGEVTGDDFDTHVKESRLNIYVSFLEKKTRYLKQPQILVLFLLQPFSWCFKTSCFKKTKKLKKAPPGIKNHRIFSVFFQIRKNLHPSPSASLDLLTILRVQ